jgi:hypothetical protein
MILRSAAESSTMRTFDGSRSRMLNGPRGCNERDQIGWRCVGIEKRDIRFFGSEHLARNAQGRRSGNVDGHRSHGSGLLQEMEFPVIAQTSQKSHRHELCAHVVTTRNSAYGLVCAPTMQPAKTSAAPASFSSD